MITAAERIAALRKALRDRGLAACVIPSSDPHLSEYLPARYRARHVLSGFTGSCGTLVVTEREAGVWTDGRYYVQGEKQLAGTGIALHPIQRSAMDEIGQFLCTHLQKGERVYFDPATISSEDGRRLCAQLTDSGVPLVTHLESDPIDEVWPERPALTFARMYALDPAVCGETVKSKLSRLRLRMSELGAETCLLSDIMDIAWLFNIRADMPYFPVPYAYAVVSPDQAWLFANTDGGDDELRRYFLENGVTWMPYEGVLPFLADHRFPEPVLLNEGRTNYALWAEVEKNCRVVSGPDFVAMFKLQKNAVEIENMRRVHVEDGAAVTKFICRVKNELAEGSWTEYTASELLRSYREAIPDYLGPSFPTICAYGENAAMVHYVPSEHTAGPLYRRGLLMVDSGGHYARGSTDVTRTICLGPVTDGEKRDYTNVLRSVIRMSALRFPRGCSGSQLDVVARSLLWSSGYDYKHRTGHGVGFVTNIHEGPISLHYADKAAPDFAEGMIVSCEPGVYRKDQYGMRLENLLVCREDIAGDTDQFLAFDTLTLVPFDTEPLLLDEMEQWEKEWLDGYHRTVYSALSPLLDEQTRAWLYEATLPVCG